MARRPSAKERRNALKIPYSVFSKPEYSSRFRQTIAMRKRAWTREGKAREFQWFGEIALETDDPVLLAALVRLEELRLDDDNAIKRLKRKPVGQTYDGRQKRWLLAEVHDYVWQGYLPQAAAEIMVAMNGLGDPEGTAKTYAGLVGKIDPIKSLRAAGLTPSQIHEAMNAVNCVDAHDSLVASEPIMGIIGRDPDSEMPPRPEIDHLPGVAELRKLMGKRTNWEMKIFPRIRKINEDDSISDEEAHQRILKLLPELPE